MKKFVKWAAVSCVAALAGGIASADQFIAVELSGGEQGKGLMACAGSEEQPARFGGVQVDGKGRIQVLVPTQDYGGGLMESVTVTVAGNGMAGQAQVNLAEYYAAKGREPVTVRMARSNMTCGKTITGAEYAKAWSERAEALSEEVLREARKNYGQVTPDLYSRYVSENTEALNAYAKVEFVPSLPTRAGLADALAKIEEIQRKKERDEAFKKFIRDLAAAAEAYAEERQKKIAEARAKARAEAEAKAAEEAREAAAREDEEKQIEINEGCFGAIGPGCGIWELKFPPSLCGPDTIQFTGADAGVHWGCAINAGSWGHDECCAFNPDGHWCFGPGTANQQCAPEFDLGLQNLLSPFTWERKDIDISKRNTTGIVVHDDYCAEAGTVMRKNETGYCCSKVGGNLSGAQAARFTFQHGAWAFLIFWGEVKACQP